MKKTAYIVTTIQYPTPALRELNKLAREQEADMIIAGDKKTPADFQLEGAWYLSPPDQKKLYPELAEALPWNHYSRKNLAYLAAISAGAGIIRETDDDNAPMPDYAFLRKEKYYVRTIQSDDSWINIYQAFTSTTIWPRGFSLKQASRKDSHPYSIGNPEPQEGLILQGLTDGHPDIDALYRLVNGNLRIRFSPDKMIKLQPGQWCPFNSQNTLFESPVFPLLYLPSGCSIRLTDIWRSFVAQRCLWEMNEGVVFHYSTMIQERNEHDFYKDFQDEMPGYLLHDDLVETLASLSLSNDLIQNLMNCYKAMVTKGFVPKSELNILDRWLNELVKIWKPEK